MAVAVLLILSHGQYILEPDNKLPLTRHNFPVCIMTAAPIGVCFLVSDDDERRYKLLIKQHLTGLISSPFDTTFDLAQLIKRNELSNLKAYAVLHTDDDEIRELYNTIDRGYNVGCYIDGTYNKTFYNSGLLLMNAGADVDIMSILGDPVDLNTVLSYLSSIGFTSVTIFDFSCNGIVTADFGTPSARLLRELRNNVHKHSMLP